MLKLPEQPAAGEPPIYTDPSLETFEAAGMKYGRLRTFSPSALGPTISAIKGGFKQRKTMGEPWQQGGALVVEKSGKVAFAYASDDPGDHVPVKDVLAALGGKPA